MNTICIGCGRPTPKNRHGRCERCMAVVADRRAAKGYDIPAVRQAMKAAVQRDGRCRICGSVERLGAHLPGGGVHPADPNRYVTLCSRCHGHVDGGRRLAG